VRIWAGALWLLLFTLGSAAGEPIVGWLPEETLVCLTVEGRARSAARLAEGRYAELRGDPAAQRLGLEAKALLAVARERSLADGDPWLGAFWELAQGELVLAVVRARGRPAPLVLLDLGDRPEAFREHLARLARAGVLGAELAHGEIRARPGAEGVGAVFWIQRGSRVAFSWREGAVEEVLARLSGGPGVAARRDFAAVRERLKADADLWAFLPRAALRELEARSTDVRAGVDALGLPEEGALGLSLALAPDALELRAFVFAPGPRRRLLKLLDRADGPLAPPASLPRDTRALVAMRLDLRRALDLAREMLPADAAELDRLARGESGELATSFLRALGRRFALAYVGPREEQVLLAELEREAWLRRLIASVTGRRGDVFEGPDGALAIREGWLRAAPRVDLVRGDGPLPGFDRAQAGLPERRAMLWYLAPPAPRAWDDPARLLGAQAGALTNEADGVLLVHRVLLR
jgi:hypothetical protein